MRGDRNDGESQQGFAGERTAGACRGAFPGTQLEERGRSSQSSLCNIDMKTPAGGLLQRLTRCLEMQSTHSTYTRFSVSPLSFLLYFFHICIIPLRFVSCRICTTSPTTWCASCLHPSQILKSSTLNLTSTKKDWSASGSSMKSLLTLMR